MLDELDEILKQVSNELEELSLTNLEFVDRLVDAINLHRGSDDDSEDFSFRG